MILVSMERGDPTIYYGTKQLYFGPDNFKITGGGNHPLRKTCYKKGSGRRGLILYKSVAAEHGGLFMQLVSKIFLLTISSLNVSILSGFICCHLLNKADRRTQTIKMVVFIILYVLTGAIR